MKNLKNRKWTLAKRPIGMVGEHNFSFEEEEVRDIQEGEFLIKNLYLLESIINHLTYCFIILSSLFNLEPITNIFFILLISVFK